MKKAEQLVGKQVVCQVRLDHYRWPRKKVEILPGHYAVVIFNVISLVKGELPEEFKSESGDFSFIAAGSTLPVLNNKMTYLMTGTLTNNHKYGYQYGIDEIHIDYDLRKESDQRKFFSFFLSEERINLLFETLEDPLKCLQNRDLKELQRVKGIGPIFALKMCEKFEECKGNSRAYVALKDLGLTKKAIDNLVKHYHSADVAVDKVYENPYILIKEVRGYGWEKADNIALKQGFGTGSKERVKAYAQYYLEQQADANGNSWVSIDNLLENILAMCKPATKEEVAQWIKEDMVGQSDFEDYIKNIDNLALVYERPMFYYEKEQRRVGLFYLRLLEKQIAQHLARLKKSEFPVTFEKEVCEKIIKETEKEVGYEYTDEQKKAIWNILQENVNILTASAGSGKSSTLRPLVKIFRHYGLKVEQTALSGRASSLLSEITDVEGKTIHRLLGFMPEQERFSHTERNPLKADVVILDETSMVGEELFLNLISAIKNGAKFVMLGDIKQLPPIYVGNILSDCIRSGYITTNILTKIHRQAALSGIVTQSLVAADGRSLVKNDFIGEEIRGELHDFKIIASYDRNLLHNNVIKEYRSLLIDRCVDPNDIQIIAPTKLRGENSCYALNEVVQNIVNPKVDNKSVTVTFIENGTKFNVDFRPKDRVIVNHNNYHALDSNGNEQPIFNGNIGVIKDISSDIMIVNFPEQGDILLSREEWYNLNLAYAITIHKSQGGQAPYVIIAIDNTSYALLSRELIYTAITRAQKYCALIVQPRALNTATKTSSIKLKQTWLKDDLLKIYLEEMEAQL